MEWSPNWFMQASGAYDLQPQTLGIPYIDRVFLFHFWNNNPTDSNLSQDLRDDIAEVEGAKSIAFHTALITGNSCQPWTYLCTSKYDLILIYWYILWDSPRIAKLSRNPKNMCSHVCAGCRRSLSEYGFLIIYEHVGVAHNSICFSQDRMIENPNLLPIKRSFFVCIRFTVLFIVARTAFLKHLNTIIYLAPFERFPERVFYRWKLDDDLEWCHINDIRAGFNGGKGEEKSPKHVQPAN